jgi:breast cancer 2 susceptibility protein
MNVIFCATTNHLYGVRRSAVVDNIVSEYQKERTGSHIYDYGDSEGAKIYKMLETAAEPEYLMADMSPEQLNSFAAYKAKLNVRLLCSCISRSLYVERYLWFHIHLQAIRQSQMESSIEKALKDSGLGNREVTPFMRLRVVGLTYKTRREKPKEGIVTIWSPTQKQVSLMSQLQRLIIFSHVNNFSAFFWL